MKTYWGSGDISSTHH